MSLNTQATVAAAPRPEAMKPFNARASSTSFVMDIEAEPVYEKPPAYVDKCCGFYDCGPAPTEGHCGLPPEGRPDLVWVKEDLYGFYVPAFFFIAILCSTAVWAVAPEALTILRPPDDMQSFFVPMAAVLILVIIYYPLGCLVWYFGVSVAFTRKVTHTLLMVVIPLGATATSHGEGLGRDIFLSCTWQALSTCIGVSLVWLIPMRRYFHVLRISFAAIERTEDRPNALLFVLMQSTAMTMVQTPMIQWMLYEEKGLLIWIPFLAVALGDGLAEPIGRMYGKHKYEVYAIGTDKKFTRSYEGSACVYIFTLLAVLIALPEMTWFQANLCLWFIPAANTYAEARSPHTFDNHIMWGVTWVLLIIIFDWIPWLTAA